MFKKRGVIIGLTVIAFSFCLTGITKADNNLLKKALGIRDVAESEDYGYGYDSEVPDAPTNLAKIERHTKMALLGWDASAGDITSYVIKYGLNTNFNKRKTVSGDYTFALLTSLKSNRKYYAKVKAVDENGSSEFSDTITFRTKPGKIIGLRHKKKLKKKKSVVVKWKKTAGYKKTQYKIRVKNSKGKIVKRLTTKKKQKKITDLKAGKRYYIQVRAYYGSKNKGNWSRRLRVKTAS